MSIKLTCPCDIDGVCPYDAQYSRDCEYFCGADEPDDYPDAEYFSGEDMELFEVDFCDEPND